MDKPVFTYTFKRMLLPETNQYEYVLIIEESLLIDKDKDFLIPNSYIANTFIATLKDRFDNSNIRDKVYTNIAKVR